MQIIESWQAEYGPYAIVRHTKTEQKNADVKEFEAMWLDVDEESCDCHRREPILRSFDGYLYSGERADFDTLEQARGFLLEANDSYQPEEYKRDWDEQMGWLVDEIYEKRQEQIEREVGFYLHICKGQFFEAVAKQDWDKIETIGKILAEVEI